MKTIVPIAVFLVLFVSRLNAQVTRMEFYESLTQVQIGDSADSVKRLLGAPDDIVTKDEFPLARLYGRTSWRYGCKKHLGFASRGRVDFDEDVLVTEVFGGSRIPEQIIGLDEAQLVQLLELLDALPRSGGKKYDPMALATTANVFQPLGQETTLAVMREYARVADFKIREFASIDLLLRCLHQVPADPGYLPKTLGSYLPRPPVDHRVTPKYPLYFVDDIPLFLVTSFHFLGTPPSIERYLSQYEKKIEWIATPLNVEHQTEESIHGKLDDFFEANEWNLNDEEAESLKKNMFMQVEQFTHRQNELAPVDSPKDK